MRCFKIVLVFLLSFLIFGIGFSSSVKKKKNNKKPQKDYYHRNFNDMDRYLERALDKDYSEDGNFKRRSKKS